MTRIFVSFLSAKVVSVFDSEQHPLLYMTSRFLVESIFCTSPLVVLHASARLLNISPIARTDNAVIHFDMGSPFRWFPWPVSWPVCPVTLVTPPCSHISGAG